MFRQMTFNHFPHPDFVYHATDAAADLLVAKTAAFVQLVDAFLSAATFGPESYWHAAAPVSAYLSADGYETVSSLLVNKNMKIIAY